MIHILKDRDGLLFVATIDTLSTEPTAQLAFYPTGMPTHRAEYNTGWDLVGKRAGWDDLMGVYFINNPHGPGGVRIELKDGRDTRPEFIERIPLDPPKTRKRGKVFWDAGEWWITQAKGLPKLLLSNREIEAEIAAKP
jgi:hypothetical protein